MSELSTTKLSTGAARVLTDEVKADAAALWSKLLQLYEGGAHTALGYSSWGTYYEAEFGQSDASAYRLLQSARVMDQLPMGSPRPASERVARELVPVVRDHPERVPEVWANVIELHGSKPTAAQVREVVHQQDDDLQHDVDLTPKPETVVAPDAATDYPYSMSPDKLRANWPPEDGDAYCPPTPAEHAIVWLISDIEYAPLDDILHTATNAGKILGLEPSCADVRNDIIDAVKEINRLKDQLVGVGHRLLTKIDDRRLKELAVDGEFIADFIATVDRRAPKGVQET